MSPKMIALTSFALIILGCLIAAIFTTVALDAAGVVIGGIGLVGLISSAFYAIGLSEDRAREQDLHGPSR